METAALLAESILLDTFAYLGDRLFAADANAYTEDTLAVRIKRILDENLSDPTLSLNKIASALSYSPNIFRPSLSAPLALASANI